MYKKTFKLSFSKWAAAATTTTPDVCICLIGGKNESLIFCSQDISIERRQIYSRTKCIQKQNYSLKKNRHYWNCIYQLQIAMRNNIYFLFLLCIKATALITYAYIIYIYIGGASRRANSARHFLFFTMPSAILLAIKSCRVYVGKSDCHHKPKTKSRNHMFSSKQITIP